MQKQKRIATSQEQTRKSKDKYQRTPSWSEDNFKELYPQQPQIQTSSTFFAVGLNYRGNLIKVKVPTGVNNSSLPYIFHKEIYKFLLNIKDNNPLLKTAQIVGFETVDYNLLLDYQISIGKGVLTQKTTFNCLEYVPQGRLKKYKIYKCLAIGGFSKVYLVRSLKDGNFYAMKVMLKKFISSTQKESIIENEKNISAQLNHPFIVKLNHAFETTNFVCFVLDYCPGGELFYHLKKVKRMKQADARFYFIEILYGLLYLHQQKIIYRDLKPENLLINHDGHIKIADFGLSKQNMKQKELTYSFCGSTQYMPPEMILREGHSFGVDFYTLGALLYELVTGLPPFYSKDEEEIKQAIISQDLTFPDHIPLSSQIKNLLTGLLHKNQKMRIGSIKGLKQILFHPWVGKINAETILSKQLQPPYVPDIDQFNFDQNELGDDQAQFTQALVNEHLIAENKQVLIYKNFEFLNQKCLRPEVKAIYDKYGDYHKRSSQNFYKIDGCADQKSDKKRQVFKKCNSLKNLKNRNTSGEIFMQRLKRQASSPYLRSASLNNVPSTKKNKTLLYSSSQQKLFKGIVNKAKDSLSKSSSKKSLKSNFKTASYGQKSFQSLNYSKNIKKKSTRLNNKQNQLSSQLVQNAQKIVRSNAGHTGNPFLKKKKLVYNYIQD